MQCIQYIVPMHGYHNIFMIISFPTIYAIFMILMHMKTRIASRLQQSHKITKAEKMVEIFAIFTKFFCTDIHPSRADLVAELLYLLGVRVRAVCAAQSAYNHFR